MRQTSREEVRGDRLEAAKATATTAKTLAKSMVLDMGDMRRLKVSVRSMRGRLLVTRGGQNGHEQDELYRRRTEDGQSALSPRCARDDGVPRELRATISSRAKKGTLGGDDAASLTMRSQPVGFPVERRGSGRPANRPSLTSSALSVRDHPGSQTSREALYETARLS